MSASSTPLMQQYQEIKGRHQDAILLFRMGDFYEMFYEDAETASRVLGLTLTSRNNGGAASVPLAGVPVKAVGDYLRRLVQHGFRVAVCEQIEDPKVAKGIVKRAVVETITPGAAFSDDLLETHRNNFLCALYNIGEHYGVAAADVSTGAFELVLTSAADVEATVARFAPRELLVVKGSALVGVDGVLSLDGVLLTEREGWEFEPAMSRDALTRHFALHSLDGIGLDGGAESDVIIGAGGALLRYMRELQPAGLPQLSRPSVERAGRVMPLDDMTRRNLELVESLRRSSDANGTAERSGTLLGVLDRTQTPMGARLLRQWLLAPLKDITQINSRLDAVTVAQTQSVARGALREALDGTRDIERLAGKAAAGRAAPRDLRALGDSLRRLPEVHRHLATLGTAGVLGTVADAWDMCADIAEAIVQTLVERPPISLGDSETIARGVDAGLDELRELRDGGRDAIARIQTAERERTGINSLKVGYNKVFGYYIEVTNTHRHLIPADYQRRQTLTGAERYITPPLKEYEERVLTATERIEDVERELFEKLRARVGADVRRLQGVARALAQLDVVTTLAEVASTEGYVRPVMHTGFEMDIVGGRHPVVERMMPRDTFIPNDVHLASDARLIIMTGPNMAGKSTILRQIGLIQLMAQVGAFVPATSATLGIVDRIFTRVGASDNLVRGQSTFMVEMAETSAILHTATDRSLVLLDEIGRGTSTYDGVSIAWAVSEHLHDRVGCKTVFATHYHELTQLSESLPALRNYNVSVREVEDTVLFLHRLQPGGADRSYGIEVGRLAGLPQQVIARARQVLRTLEGDGDHLVVSLAQDPSRSRRHTEQTPDAAYQLGLFAAVPHPVLEEMRGIDTDSLTPLEALKRLDALVQQVRHA